MLRSEGTLDCCSEHECQILDTLRSPRTACASPRTPEVGTSSLWASGMTAAEIVADFPELTERHVRAAIEFAALRERRLATPA